MPSDAATKLDQPVPDGFVEAEDVSAEVVVEDPTPESDRTEPDNSEESQSDADEQSFLTPGTVKDSSTIHYAGYVRAVSEDPIARQDPSEVQSAVVSPSDLPNLVEGGAVSEIQSEYGALQAGKGDSIQQPLESHAIALESSASLPKDVFYDDPFLLGLIELALRGNQELRILSEEIRVAGNEVYARSGEYRPFVGLGAGVGVEKPGEFTRAGAVEEQLDVAPGRDFPDPLPDFLVGANVSWEIDIWKRLRNLQRAATMRYLATQEGRNFVVTRLVAEIAEGYYELLALDSRRLILDKTIEIQLASLEAARAKKAAGRGTELAVKRFQAEVRKNQAEQSVILQDIVEVENRINFLVGRYPQAIERANVEFVDMHLYALNAGVPSQLLQHRADIRQAEREVAAAGLDVRAARARFYPSLSLTAGLGWNAFSTGYLFRSPESLIYGAAGELVGPLINRRAIKADYSTANAIQLQCIYNYQQTILQAHIEVVNFITKVENYRRSIESKKEQLAALEASVDAANKLFQSARAEYVEVLLAQRELMEARMQLVDIKREQLTAIVNAYQALGGGAF